MSYLVKHYMRKEVPTIEHRASVAQAAKTMSELGTGFLIVLKDARPAGIVTERDFVNKIIAREASPATMAVGEIMSSPIISVDPDEDLLKASELMQKNNIRRLPVIKNGIIYGVLTARDIALHCADYVNRSVRDIMRWATPFGL